MADISFKQKESGLSGAWRALALAGLSGAAAGWFAAAAATMYAGGHPFGLWPEVWRYFDSNLPMIFSADGFYYLHQAELTAEGLTNAAPPFARLTAAFARLFSQPVTWAAFYLSLFVHLALGLISAAWGRRLRAGLGGVFLAALSLALLPAWLERAGPGHFDTDLVIVLFWQAGLFFLSAAFSRRIYTFGASLLCFALLSWFWQFGLALALLSLAVWAFLFWPATILSLKTRLGLAALAAVWLGLCLFLPPAKAPAPTKILADIHAYLSLAFGARSELFYLSIKELSSLNFFSFLEKIGGSLAGGLLFLLAGLILALRRPATRLPLLLSLIFFGLGFQSNRLLYLGLFPLSLALGLLPALTAEIAYERLPRLNGRAARLCGLALSGAILFSSVYWAAHQKLDIRWERGHDQLAEALRRERAAGARLWNWWDDGYFLAARAGGLTPLFDGGSQTHTMAYIAARPFMMDSRRAAANWMRFFAIRGEAALAPLIQLWGEAGAYENLERIFSAESPDGLPPELAGQLQTLPGGRAWFFPQGKVYWYLPNNFFTISNWWIPLGLSRQPERALVRHHLEAVGRDKFSYDENTRALTITRDIWDRGYQKFGLIFNTSKTPLAPPWPRGGTPYIVYSDTSPRAYICDELGLKSLPLFMMISGGDPACFRPVAKGDNWGGVWEVLP